MGFIEILLTVLGISLLVIVHETGHYLVARAFKMRVVRYSIGFGPALVRYKPKGSPTTFQVCAIPFLAYVQIAGMNPHEENDPNDPELYSNKSVLARILTIVAGPAANYLTASILVFGLALGGWPLAPKVPVVVERVMPDTPAARAGLKPGDVIVGAEGQRVRDFEHLIEVTSPRAGKATSYIVERSGRRLPPMALTPVNQDGRGMIGIGPKMEPTYKGVGEAAKAAVILPMKLTAAQLAAFGDLIKRRSTEGLIGPVGMGKLIAERASTGATEYLSILMLLSVALGMFNLLPFPALDGGRLVFLGYELVTRRRPNERIEAVVHTVGLLFLLGVLVLVTVRDFMS